MSDNSSSTNTPTATINDTYLSGYHTPWMLPVIPCFEGPPINLTCGRFTTRTGLSTSMFYFVNRTTGLCYAPSFTISECAAKENYEDAFSTSLLLHNSVALLYCGSISHPHIIFSGRCHIKNRYHNSSDHHMCTPWVTSASDLNNFCSPLQSDSTVNYDPQKYFLNFPMAYLTVSCYPTKICLDFSSGDIFDIDMK